MDLYRFQQRMDREVERFMNEWTRARKDHPEYTPEEMDFDEWLDHFMTGML